MMLAFDAPTPFSTIGRRSVSNVPAQALILLNDPFVIGQAKAWADRIVADERLKTPEERIARMYEEAFSRPPTPDELSDAMSFTTQHSDPSRPWADFAHVLMNVKEFIFLN